MREPSVHLGQLFPGVHRGDGASVAFHAHPAAPRGKVPQRQPVERPDVLLIDVRGPAEAVGDREGGEAVRERRVHLPQRRLRERPQLCVLRKLIRRLPSLPAARPQLGLEVGRGSYDHVGLRGDGRSLLLVPLRPLPSPRAPLPQLANQRVSRLDAHRRSAHPHHPPTRRATLLLVQLEQPRHDLRSLHRLRVRRGLPEVLHEAATQRERAPRLQLRAERRGVPVAGTGPHKRTLGGGEAHRQLDNLRLRYRRSQQIHRLLLEQLAVVPKVQDPQVLQLCQRGDGQRVLRVAHKVAGHVQLLQRLELFHLGGHRGEPVPRQPQVL